MDTLTLSVIIAIVILAPLAWVVSTYSFRRQRPLSEFSNQELTRAFRFVPEAGAETVKRGTMSRHEFTCLQKLNLLRINNELKRRSVSP
jgi:hypothetical protein